MPVFASFYTLLRQNGVLCILILAAGGRQAAHAKSFKEYTLNPEINKIRIQLSSGQQLELRPVKQKKAAKKSQKTHKLKVWSGASRNFWGNTLNDKIQKNTFILSDKTFYSAKNILGTKHQSTQIIMEAPPLPLKLITFGGGQIKIIGLRVPLSLSVQNNSSIRIKNTKGKLTIFQGAGSTHLDSHTGAVRIEGENAHLYVKSCRGTMNIRYFKGNVQIEDSRGTLELHSFKAPARIKKFSGKLHFLMEKSNISLKKVSGHITGFSKSGNVSGDLYPQSAKIETDAGKIALTMPNSNIWVKVESWEGKIHTPGYFHHIRTGGVDRASGRLKGAIKRKGSVLLKSKSGSIRVY